MYQVFTKSFSVVLISTLALAGCESLPSSGPDFGSNSYAPVNAPAGAPHAVVNVTPQVVKIVEKSRPDLGLGKLKGSGPASIRLGVGDVVAVTIFEASPGGLFVPLESTNSSGNFVNLPDQKVDSAGNISVPYAGSIHAAGLEPAAIQNVIEQRLASRAIEPQAVVTVKSQTSSEVSVLGDVNSPSKFPVNAKGERILDVIARAGGPKQPGYETYVTLQRRSKKTTVYFQTLVRDPSNNIYVLPNDTIYVYREPHAFTAFGAAGENGRFDFSDEQISLSDAMGKAGGLIDNRANPGAVVVYRMESRSVAAKLGVPVEKWQGDEIPVIYLFNLRDSGGFFLASQFPVHNKDVLYIGNAAVVKYLKLINAVGETTTALSAGRNTVNWN